MGEFSQMSRTRHPRQSFDNFKDMKSKLSRPSGSALASALMKAKHGHTRYGRTQTGHVRSGNNLAVPGADGHSSLIQSQSGSRRSKSKHSKPRSSRRQKSRQGHGSRRSASRTPQGSRDFLTLRRSPTVDNELLRQGRMEPRDDFCQV